MIGLLWHRWFDSREHRRARVVAEQNYSRLLVKYAQEKARTEDLGQQCAALAEAGDGRTADLHERMVNAENARDEARQRAKALEKVLDARDADDVTRKRIDDAHADTSVLPAALNRDRRNALQLAVENAQLRTEIEDLKRKYEGNPS